MATPRSAFLVTAMIAPLAFVALATGPSACGGGPATSIPMPSGKQEPGTVGNEPGTGGSEPGTARSEPGTTGNEPAGAGPQDPSGTAAGSTTCLKCGTYTCQVTANGQTTTVPVTFEPDGSGGCLIPGGNDTLACGGSVVATNGQNKGATVGSWQATGGGGFSISGNGSSVTCTPSAGSIGGSPGTTLDAG